MIKNKLILAVVPARGGSKGIPLKNIRPLQGVPLVAWVGKLLKEMPEIDRKVVSTDHPQIAKIAEESGLSVPFFRPPSLSGDQIGDWDVLVHALEEMEKKDGVHYDVVLMLQPTSPLRTPSQVRETLFKLINENLDSVWTVSPTNLKFHPLKQLKVEGGRLSLYDDRGSSIVARQQLTPLYHRNGVAYAVTRQCLLEQKTILGAKSGAVVVDGPVANIDTITDFDQIEKFLES